MDDDRNLTPTPDRPAAIFDLSNCKLPQVRVRRMSREEMEKDPEINRQLRMMEEGEYDRF